MNKIKRLGYKLCQNFFVNKGTRKLIIQRFHSIQNSNNFLPKNDGDCLALVSLSNDIYLNLALENYIAESINSKKGQSVLLIWISEPCVVIGRHQNPWIECNAKEMNVSEVKLARRYSGGGCVYHDLGNLNISFICDRLKYDRKLNLNLIKNTLDKSAVVRSSIDTSSFEFVISPRHDLFLKLNNSSNADENHEMFKISGSASRLAKNFSYHHCTLLYEANMSNMNLLRSNLLENITNNKATPSVRSKVINLKDYLNQKGIMNMIERLCVEYWQHNSANWSIQHLFNYVNPSEDQILKLIDSNVQELKSWEYIYGSTPKFNLSIPLDNQTKLELLIQNGLIKSYEIKYLENQNKIVNDERDLTEFKKFMDEASMDCKLWNEDLRRVINSSSLNLNSNKYLKLFFDFINKHIA